MSGFVYVLSNPAMPGLVKIGYTLGSVAERARDLSGATGVPVPFFVEYSHETLEPAVLEAVVHSDLESRRVNIAREFFRETVAEAVEAIKGAAASEMFWFKSMMAAWNAAGPDARDDFLRRIGH